MNGKLKAILLLAVMFGLGVVSGIAWQTYRYHHMDAVHTLFAERRIKRLKTQLNLTPEQEQAMREIFQKAHERATEINEEVSWDLADIHRDSVQAIHKILTPAQTQEFEKLHKKYHIKHAHLPDDDLDESTAPVKAAS